MAKSTGKLELKSLTKEFGNGSDKVVAVRELSRSGKPHELMQLAGIDAAAIVACVEKLVKKQ